MLITQADFMRALLGTVRLTPEEWFVGLIPAVLLFGLWEAGKAVARSRSGRGPATTDQPAVTATPATSPAAA